MKKLEHVDFICPSKKPVALYLSYAYVLIPGMSRHQEKSYAILLFLWLLLMNAFSWFCTFAICCDANQPNS